MILIDTNVFLEFLLKQERSAECERLLDSVSKGEREAVVTHFSLHGIESLLDARSLELFLRDIEGSQGLYVYDTDLAEETAASRLGQEVGRDFDDTLQYYVAKKAGADAIVSFDKHFDRLDVRRVEPSDLLADGKNIR